MADYKTLVSPPSERERYETGAHRSPATGKGRFDLIPWDMVHRWATLMERGGAEYGDRNWEKGIPLYRFLDSAARHLAQWLLHDHPEEDHAAAIFFNVAGFEWTLQRIKDKVLPASLAKGVPWVEAWLARNFRPDAVDFPDRSGILGVEKGDPMDD